ncbi:hypothetical protein [Photobacterium damselae]|uniref:hypothetical protein n=1 Tax=Photobacterium damselae TaxID=38293 RepID=UPI000D06A48E|nr:hypothetical protein [Photobacterium damselae]AWK84235.1 hypothetical protein BST98_19890 [Photobacterium damselae]MCG3815876.1 hypothetical protein [Photobacterium damselae]PSB80811.1 hypothetical protein C5F61_03465 [Photobacterium damselae subsp. damselae]USR75166.1 hypothetical protein NGM67_03780 [Photobacterium damselae]
MKKTMTVLAIAGLCAMSAGASAATDSSRGTINWSGTVPGVIPGSSIIVTGAGKGEIQQGTLVVDTDGTFVSKSSVTLESHSYDETQPEADQIGDLIEATWSIEDVTVIPATYNADDIKVSFNGNEVSKGTPLAGVADTIYVEVRNEVANDQVKPQDTVQVTTTAMASVQA